MTTNTTIQASAEGAGKARQISFFVVLTLFALLHVRFSPLPYAVLGWFLEEETVSHRVHEIAFGWIFVISLVGLLTHVRRARERLAEMYQVVIATWLIVAALLLVEQILDPIVIAFFVLPVVLLVLHPGRAGLLRPSLNVSRTLAVLTAVAAVPLIIYAVTEFRTGLDASRVAPQILDKIDPDIPEDEFEEAFNEAARQTDLSVVEIEEVQHFGHWSGMGAFCLIIIGLATVASMRPRGWRWPAWFAGLSAILFGLASVANQGDASALNIYWSLLAIGWGICFIATAEVSRRGAGSTMFARSATAG